MTHAELLAEAEAVLLEYADGVRLDHAWEDRAAATILALMDLANPHQRATALTPPPDRTTRFNPVTRTWKNA